MRLGWWRQAEAKLKEVLVFPPVSQGERPMRALGWIVA
jgi:hypothetical protein